MSKKNFGGRSFSRLKTARHLFEGLEPRLLMAANPVISEFLAKNSSGLLDGNNNYSDWIEIQNTGDASVDLQGWHLSDDPAKPDKWTFPTKPLAAGGFLVVFADGSGVVDPGGYLHTNFSLSTTGETLSLTRPDLTVASRWNADGTAFPAQAQDISYGTGTIYHNTTILGANAPASAFVPHDAALDANQWTAPGYIPTGWTTGNTGVGYDTGGYEDNSEPAILKADWNADDLAANLTSGATVTSWQDDVGGHKALASVGSPKFIPSVINGHSVVRFTPSDGNDSLRVPTADNPMSGAEDFTVAVVFNAATGTGANANWYNNAGIVDGEVSGTHNDWGLTVSTAGNVAAGMGSPDTTVYSANPSVLNSTHVAVFTRSAGQFWLYIDGGNGVTAASSVVPRDLQDMVFGSLQTKLNYFNGDLAEVQVYDGSMNAAAVYRTASSLGTKYAVAITTPTVPANPSPIADWTADSVTAASGAPVTQWNSSSATYFASANSSSTAPTFTPAQLNGHAVLHFNGAANNQLVATSSHNPMSGANDFSIAVVFRTSTPGVGSSTTWTANTGIVDATQTTTTADWGLGINSSGAISAGIGSPDNTIYSGGGFSDANAHVAIYTRVLGATELYVDGSTAFDGVSATAARNAVSMAFGSLLTNGNYFTGDLAEVQVYNAALTDDSAGALAATLGAKYGISLSPPLYAPLIGLNVQSAMYQTASTADIRIPFTVDNPSQYARLQLQMQYDDGFVAYLNGTEIARRNAPAGPITYTSVATQIHPKSLALTPETIDVSQFLGLLQGGGATNVLAIKALNLSASNPDLLINPQLIAATATTGPAYFSNPTPGAANGAGFTDSVKSISFSTTHGYFSSSFSDTITDATPGSTIIYTTDGTEPSLTNGTVVSPASATATPSVTLNITTTTTLRAAAFEDAYLPSGTGTETYIFPVTVLTQQNTAPVGAYWSSAVNPVSVNAVQTYSVTQALTSIPTVSLVLPFADMFGPTGIYTNPKQGGDLWERATSVEYFDPNNPTNQFQINAGVRIQGGADRNPQDPKKSFRLFFRSEYGASTLNFPILGTTNPQQSFDHILLKAIHNYSWANPGGTPPNQGDLLRDQFARDTQLAITGNSAAGKWVQVFIDGQYWGLYNVVEEPDATWAAANFGGSKNNYDVLQGSSGGIDILSGTSDAYFSLFNTLTADFADGSINPTEYTALKPLVDMKGIADYMINIFYRGDQDAPVVIGGNSARNFYIYRNAASSGPFEFETWDGEFAMGDVNYNRTTVSAPLTPALLFQDLKTNPDFAQLFADETYRLFYNGGPLQSDSTVDIPRQRYDADATAINIAIVGESARWGSVQTTPATPLMRDTDWLSEIASLDNNYFPQRSGIVLGQLKAISQLAMLGTLPPSFFVGGVANRGGKVSTGASLTLPDTNAVTTGDVIYYTLDGSDPRLGGGGISSAARIYSGALPIATSETVTVRIKNGTTWSPIDAATYEVNAPAAAGNIAITEVDYHPADPTAAELAVNSTWTNSDFEFIELLNTSAGTVDLINAKFDLGVTGTLGNFTLAPGARAVVVANSTAFRARYGNGPVVVGSYTGHLSNSGATVELKSAANVVIQNFAYANTGSWPNRPDGEGSSLEVLNTAGNYNDPLNWRQSYEYNGTPGTAGSPITDVVINEVLAAPAAGGQQSIELFNTTPSPINVGGWYISNTHHNYLLYRIPDNTIIAGGGYLVITSASFNPTPTTPGPHDFTINGTAGDNLVLVKATPTGALQAFPDDVIFPTAAIGEAFGRTPNGTGPLYPEVSTTLGTTNSGPRLGPVNITEFTYNTTAANSNLQYIELQNQTNVVVDISGWQFDAGVTFTFPAGTTLQPFEVVTVVHFNPATDTASLAAFQSAYGVPATARLFGPFPDKLSTKGEELTLVRPDTPRADNPGYIPLILVDDVTYGIASPWPVTAVAQALTRLSNHTFGETSTNWSAQSPSVGYVPYGNAYFGNATQFTYTAPTTLDSLTLAGTAGVTLGVGAGHLFTAGGLTLPAGTKFDAGSTDLDLSNVTLTAIRTWITSGFAGGLWTGPGIISSAAGGDSTHLTTLGLIQNNQTGTAIYTAANKFDGITPGVSDVLVKYTYYGDANLDGRVDGSDYTKIDAAFGTSLSGWLNGDFNYDGTIDGSDYTLIDNGFNTQGVSHASLIAVAVATNEIASSPAVPANTKAYASAKSLLGTASLIGSIDQLSDVAVAHAPAVKHGSGSPFAAGPHRLIRHGTKSKSDASAGSWAFVRPV